MKRTPIATFVTAGVAFILALIPFHAFLSVWGASLFGHYTLLRLWKELLLVPLVAAAVWLALRKDTLRQELKRLWLFKLLLAYVVLELLLGLAALKRHEVNHMALAEGLIVDLRLMTIFFVAWVAAGYSPWLKGHWKQLLLIPGVVVVIFGLLQIFVLPADFLTHFGYSATTIQPFDTVDHNMQFVRIQSTLRGADPLGAYLIPLLAAMSAIGFCRLAKGQKEVIVLALYGLAAITVLYFTYSRSAYVGAVLAVFGVAYLSLTSYTLKRWLLISVVTVCVLFGGLALLLRHNPTFEDTFFHTSQLSQSPQSSNQHHTAALKTGLDELVHEPFGRGPGTAGPASEHNNHPARIAENYFLQIGQEVGWLGLGLFVMVNVLIGRLLWRRRAEADQLALVLFVSLVALSFVNMLLHAWADDTLAYIWWGFTGIAVAPVVAQSRTSHTKRVH